jgi:hypothetical protein
MYFFTCAAREPVKNKFVSLFHKMLDPLAHTLLLLLLPLLLTLLLLLLLMMMMTIILMIMIKYIPTNRDWRWRYSAGQWPRYGLR